MKQKAAPSLLERGFLFHYGKPAAGGRDAGGRSPTESRRGQYLQKYSG
jgi:hypothetical protein